MKVTILTPPALVGKYAADRVYGCNYGYYPVPNIFLLTSAAVIEEDGHEVAYVDGAMEGWSRRQLIEFLRKDDSDVYIVYTVYLSQETDQLTVQLLREYRGDSAFVFMGTVPSEIPERFLHDENTYVVRGEPEETFIEFLNAKHICRGCESELKKKPDPMVEKERTSFRRRMARTRGPSTHRWTREEIRAIAGKELRQVVPDP